MKFEIPSGTTGVLAATVIGLVLSAGSSLSPISASAAVSAAGTGCPALGNPKNNSGMQFIGLLSPEEAVARSVAQITDAWYAAHGFVKEEFIEERVTAVASLDKNNDGLICLAMTWGQNLNPNSHWAEIEADLLSPPATERWAFTDNHNGTSNKR